MAQIPSAITTLCQVSMEPERELVTQAGERSFAIYSPEVFTAHGHCTNGSLVQRYISHTTILTLDSGCDLELRQHILAVPFSIVTPRQPIMEYTNWDTLEVPKQVLLNMDRNEMRMYDFLPADHNLSVQVDDGIRMSQTQLAVLHHRLSQQVEEAHNNGFWITVAVSILLGFLFTVLRLQHRDITSTRTSILPQSRFRHVVTHPSLYPAGKLRFKEREEYRNLVLHKCHCLCRVITLYSITPCICQSCYCVLILAYKRAVTGLNKAVVIEQSYLWELKRTSRS